MKLLFVHQRLGEFGGAEANIQLVAEELRTRGHCVGLLYSHRTGRNEAQWAQTFSECFCLTSRGNTEIVEAVLERFAPDLVYLHNLPDLKVIEALLSSKIPAVRMVHDHTMYCMRSYKYNYFNRQICTRALSPYCIFPCLAPIGRGERKRFPIKWVSYAAKQKEIELNRRCQRLVVYSDYQKKELVRNGFAAGNVETCVPIRVAPDEDLASSLSQGNGVLYAGQIVRGKGVDVLLEALAKVKTEFHCEILGEGNHRARCQQLCSRLGLNGRVHFHGYVPPAQMKRFYLEANVFVMSSLWPEPFGLAGPEAMRYGLPVVAFDAGGIHEWLSNGQNGFLVPWRSTGEFAARLDQLLGDKELARQMGRRARETVKRYDAPLQIDHLENLFQRVIHQTPTQKAASPDHDTKILTVYD